MKFHLYLFCILIFGYSIIAQGETLLEKQCNELKEFINIHNLNNLNIAVPPDSPDKYCHINGYCIRSNLRYNVVNNEIIQLEFYNIQADINLDPLKSFSNLQNLSLAFNRNADFPKIFDKFQKLKILQIVDNYKTIKEFPNIGILHDLEKIWIKNIRVEKIEGLNENKKLAVLNLYNSEVDKITSFPPNLESLYVGDNVFKDPDSLFEDIINSNMNLKNLFFTGNGVEKIPKSINKLSNLKKLNVTDNKITVLPNELYEIKSLEMIDFSKNRFQNVVFGFNGTTLKTCSLDPGKFCFRNKGVCSEDVDKLDCTPEYEKNNEVLLDKVYEKKQEENNDDDKPKLNKAIIISIVVAVVLTISILVFFFINKNKKGPEYIKDDNNATYAYSTNEESKKIINEYNLNKSENKPEEINTSNNDHYNDIANISQANINTELNNNGANGNYNSPINNSFNNLNDINTSQQSINYGMDNSIVVSSPLMNNAGINAPFNNGNMGVNVPFNNNGNMGVNIPFNNNGNMGVNVPFNNNGNMGVNVPFNNNGNMGVNVPFNNNGNMGVNVPFNNNGNMGINIPFNNNMGYMNENNSMQYNFSVAVPPVASSSSISKKELLLQENNIQIDEDKAKLHAKIRKEMLATEEMLLDKKSKGNNNKNDEFDEPPPSYTQF
ncbi:L domain-like protein [Piromyces finnis]|uniref:L domain-like protein n=1 Tax=Piromyces finnis TaxID=1754191 RepID=A0A1Y1VHN7_9FUNG|nr:L domain-like protein [Piromyces finnis]|eukprot:ORX55281.1 L domain-like protein [Piromyces finnis]